MEDIHERFMREALKMARVGLEKGELPIGAVKEADFPNYRVPKITGGLLRQEGIDLFKEYVARHSSGALWEWAGTIAAL